MNDGDFSPLPLLTFEPGNADNRKVCTSVSGNPDNLVEGEEVFSLKLGHSCGGSIDLGDDETVVTIIDSDGTYACYN